MILFNYLSVCFGSPGVILAKAYTHLSASEKKVPNDLQWKAVKSQGGCFLINSPVDLEAERRRLTEHRNTQLEEVRSIR